METLEGCDETQNIWLGLSIRQDHVLFAATVQVVRATS